MSFCAQTEAEFKSHFASMPWLALQYRDPQCESASWYHLYIWMSLHFHIMISSMWMILRFHIMISSMWILSVNEFVHLEVTALSALIQIQF